MKKNDKKFIKKAKSERAFTLLEYCAGAAVMIGVVYVALNALGGNLSGLLDSLSTWATNRKTQVSTAN